MSINWSDELKNKVLDNMFKGKPLKFDPNGIDMHIIGVDLAGEPDQTAIGLVHAGSFKAHVTPEDKEYKEVTTIGGPSQYVVTKVKKPLLTVELSDLYSKALSMPGPVVEICTADNPKPPGPSDYLWEHPDKKEHYNPMEDGYRYYCPHCKCGARVFKESKVETPPGMFSKQIDVLISQGGNPE